VQQEDTARKNKENAGRKERKVKDLYICLCPLACPHLLTVSVGMFSPPLRLVYNLPVARALNTPDLCLLFPSAFPPPAFFVSPLYFLFFFQSGRRTARRPSAPRQQDNQRAHRDGRTTRHSATASSRPARRLSGSTRRGARRTPGTKHATASAQRRACKERAHKGRKKACK
jgi:hypothetical protein